jgi:hypothetical protein
VNVIEELGLSQFDNEAPFALTQLDRWTPGTGAILRKRGHRQLVVRIVTMAGCIVKMT